MNLNERLQQGRTGLGLSGGTSPPVLQSSELSASTDEAHRDSWILHLYGASDDLAVSMWILVTRGHSDINSFFCPFGCAELHSTSDWDPAGSAVHVLCSCSHTSMQMHTMLIIFLIVICILHLLLLFLPHCKWSKFCGLKHTTTAVISSVIPTILSICCKLNLREILNSLKYYSPFILWWHLQAKTTTELKYAGYIEIHINGSSLYSYSDLCAVKYYALNQFSHLV